ncbi:MAG: phage tail length tape measure family protein, partial [Pseudomonadota bacterium]|nr:phage tail length tape measure family protein [Pseudomonadota bacterium]
MTLRVHASLTADGTQAKAEVAALTKQMDGLGNEMTAVNKIAADEAALFERLGAQAKGAGWGLSGFADPLAETVKTSKQASAPIRDTADGIDKLSKSSTVAAGSMGNMAAQFNDIIVMMAAGQNPLQLALQQGTQITQAFGNRGASGALRMLWGGLTSLVSPINLITIGSIAAGAAMVQWLTSSAGEAVSLEERIEGLEERISSYREVVARDLDDLKERWGDITPEVMQLQREAANLNLEEMLSAARVAASDLREELSDGGQVFRTFRDNDRRSARTGRSPVTDELKQSLATIGGEGTLEEQIKAVQTFKAEVVAAAGGWDAMNDKQRAFVGQINAVLDPLQQSMAAIQSNMGTVEAGWESLKNIWEAGKTRAEEALEQLSAEQEIVATLQNRAELAQLTAQYGEDSKAVAEARAAQEAEALHTMIDQSVKSDELNQQAHELVDALYQAGSVDVSARLEQGRATAAAMADEIQRAVNGMLTLNAQGISSLRESELRLQYKSDPVGLAGALADERFGDTTGLDPILQAAMDEKRAETIANAEQAERNRQELVAW